MSEVSTPLSLPDEAHEDLAHLAAHATDLPPIAQAVKQAKPGEELPNAVVSTVGLPIDEVERILATIWNLYRMQRKEGSDTAGFVGRVTMALEKETSDEWKKQHLAAWRGVSGEVISLLNGITDEHPFVVAGKAAMLGSAHQNCFLTARLITDIRPVFNRSGDRVVESLIIHTLLVNYFDGAERRRIQFALDGNDVKQLGRVAQRAERKAAVLKSALGGLPWVTTVFGESPAREQPTQNSDD